MFSDNENPGGEISIGQTAAATTPAPEQEPVAEMGAAVSTSAQAEAVENTAPVASSEPAAEQAAATENPEAGDASESGEASAESTAEMERLMEQYSTPHQAPVEGEIESGQVVAITDSGVVVNLGGKTEGLIPAQEFAELDGPFPLQVGQPVEIQRTGDRKDGMVLLSYQRVKRRRAWGVIEEAYRKKADITGKVVDHIKGGLVVDIGVRAFLPASQADVHPVRDLDEWKGREITVLSLIHI